MKEIQEDLKRVTIKLELTSSCLNELAQNHDKELLLIRAAKKMILNARELLEGVNI